MRTKYKYFDKRRHSEIPGFYEVRRNMIVYKSVLTAKEGENPEYLSSTNSDVEVIRLIIPKGSVIHIGSIEFSNTALIVRKCRATKAISLGNGYSLWRPMDGFGFGLGQRTKYTINKVMNPDMTTGFFVNDTCAPGIHFFLDRKSAAGYRI